MRQCYSSWNCLNQPQNGIVDWKYGSWNLEMRNGRWRALEGPASHAAADGGTYPTEGSLPYVVRMLSLFPRRPCTVQYRMIFSVFYQQAENSRVWSLRTLALHLKRGCQSDLLILYQGDPSKEADGGVASKRALALHRWKAILIGHKLLYINAGATRTASTGPRRLSLLLLFDCLRCLDGEGTNFSC